jgi:hypothetical protein
LYRPSLERAAVGEFEERQPPPPPQQLQRSSMITSGFGSIQQHGGIIVIVIVIVINVTKYGRFLLRTVKQVTQAQNKKKSNGSLQHNE